MLNISNIINIPQILRHNLRMQKKINTVIVHSRVSNENVASTLIDLISYLQELGITVLSEEYTAAKLNLKVPAVTFMEMSGKADLVIVVGGDGSMLGAAREIALSGIPVLGINRGHLGFLTDFKPSDIRASLKEFLDGNYFTEERFLLETEIHNNGKGKEKSLALNETVIHSVKTAHMMDFSIYVNDNFMYSQKADGLIVSTPTGSTAYNLSAGGPIIEPSLNVVSLVPMFPQSMNCRPFLVRADSKIKISFHSCRSPEAILVNCDGQVNMEATECSEIIITKSPKILTVCHPHSYDYFEVLRSKLGFATKIVN
jgi:NAD+ kinase